MEGWDGKERRRKDFLVFWNIGKSPIKKTGLVAVSARVEALARASNHIQSYFTEWISQIFHSYLTNKWKGTVFKYTTIPLNTRIPWWNALTHSRCTQKSLRFFLRSLVKKLSTEQHAILLNCPCDKKHLSEMTSTI